VVAENAIFGTQQPVWKEGLWGKSVLEENIQTVAFTTGGSLRQLGVGNFIQSSERQASGTVLRLSARKLYWCRYHFSSACLVRMYCIITDDHKRELFHAHFNALFYSAHHNIFVLYLHCKKYRMIPTSKWEASLHEDLKKSATFKKENLIFSNIGQYVYRVNLISRIEFVSLVSHNFLPNTLEFLIIWIYDATCHFCNCACYCTKDNTYYACQTTVR